MTNVKFDSFRLEANLRSVLTARVPVIPPALLSGDLLPHLADPQRPPQDLQRPPQDLQLQQATPDHQAPQI